MRMTRSSEVVSKDAVMCLFRIVGISVQDGVDGRLPHRHGDVGNRVLVEAGALGILLGRLLNLVDTVQGRVQGVS